MSQGQLGNKQTGLNRKLQVKTNILGMYKANKVYKTFLANNTKAEWDKYNTTRRFFPAWDCEGTLDVAREVFTITAKLPDETLPTSLAGGYAIFYDKTALQTEVTANNLKDIINIDSVGVKILSSTATEITLEEAVPGGAWTDVFIMESDYFDLPMLTDYNFSFSSNAIDVTDQYSGGATESIMGISSADLDGISGNYSIDYHIVFQLRYMNLSKGNTVDVRHFASLDVDEPVYYQTVYPNEFSVSSATDGSAQLTYAGNFINASGYPTIKSVVTKDTIPSMT